MEKFTLKFSKNKLWDNGLEIDPGEAFIGIEKPRPGEGKGLGQKHTLWDKAQF